MINKLFPYKLHLHIFQLEEYNITKFIKWIFSHYFKRTIENKKPIRWTLKAKVILSIAIILAIISLGLLTFFYKVYGFLLGILIFTQSYAFIIPAYYVLQPVELYKKYLMRKSTKQKITSLPNLRVIGVTGSYGKTSVKEFLYHMLKTHYAVLRTPESYNTPYGIAKVVNLELNDLYDYFICEMGAYKSGEIKEICDIVKPSYGILTGINEQHLESFGSLQTTTRTKFELIDSLPTTGYGIVNSDNELISKHISTYKKPLISYGFSNKLFSIKNVKTTIKGTHFSLVLNGKTYPAYTKLIGKPNLQNILAAATMSHKLGLSADKIISATADLCPVPHRLEIKPQSNMILIDNAYNSNVSGFKESITTLRTFQNPKIIVTPGIIELGKDTYEIHKQLGKLLDDLDYIFLVGKSDRTNGLLAGIHKKKKVKFINSLSEFWNEINTLKLSNPVVLLENDLPDNY